MSIASEIARINTAKGSIRSTMVSWNKALSTDDLETLATKLAGVENKGAVDIEVKEGETYTVPEGYHNGSGTVKGVAGGGSYTLQTKTVTPTKLAQPITPDDGYYGLSSVTVNAIPEAYADVTSTTAEDGDVLATKVYVKADGTVSAGTMVNNGAISLTFDPLTQTSVTIPGGYTTGGAVTLTNDLENELKAI